MKSITKEEYIELLESEDIIGLIVSTMKPSYTIPVIFEFLSIKNHIISYILTNKNPGLPRLYNRESWKIDYYSFLSDVKNSLYKEIIILNISETPDWEV